MRTVITGAGSGIGRAVALQMATVSRAETKLFLVDRDAHALEKVVSEVRRVGLQASSSVCDLSSPTAPERVVEEAHKFLGGLDGLVSNAGALQGSPLERVTAQDFDWLFSVNVRATMLLANAALPMLKEARGAIVATGSISSEQPTPAVGVYSASKAALVMLVRQMALEWGPYGIRCNCVSPGPTHTGLTDSAYSDPNTKEKRGLDIPLRRVGSPDEIASAITYLLSPAAAFITGVNLMVDGGLSQTLMISAHSAVHNIAAA